LKQAFHEIKQNFKKQESKWHMKNVIKSHSICYFATRWILLLAGYAYLYARGALYWGIRHPARIIWHRYLPKALCWGIYRPAKKAKDLLYAKLKGFLMIFHRPLLFVDYYYRSFKLVRKEPADVYHAHDLNTLPAAYKNGWETGI